MRVRGLRVCWVEGTCVKLQGLLLGFGCFRPSRVYTADGPRIDALKNYQGSGATYRVLIRDFSKP